MEFIFHLFVSPEFYVGVVFMLAIGIIFALYFEALWHNTMITAEQFKLCVKFGPRYYHVVSAEEYKEMGLHLDTKSERREHIKVWLDTQDAKSDKPRLVFESLKHTKTNTR